MKVLTSQFYQSEDVVAISKSLLGKLLITEFGGKRTSGVIVETEAYRGPDDKACHAHMNRYTKRTATMFESGGLAYIYLCYGIHHLFNVVTAGKNKPHAVLIRAVEPYEGLDHMLARRRMKQIKPQLTAGPGAMSQALGITKAYSGIDISGPSSPIRIEDHAPVLRSEGIIASARVGVGYAEECAFWPWRFRIVNNRWTSKAKGCGE